MKERCMCQSQKFSQAGGGPKSGQSCHLVYNVMLSNSLISPIVKGRRENVSSVFLRQEALSRTDRFQSAGKLGRVGFSFWAGKDFPVCPGRNLCHASWKMTNCCDGVSMSPSHKLYIAFICCCLTWQSLFTLLLRSTVKLGKFLTFCALNMQMYFSLSDHHCHLLC